MVANTVCTLAFLSVWPGSGKYPYTGSSILSTSVNSRLTNCIICFCFCKGTSVTLVVNWLLSITRLTPFLGR